MGTIPSKQSNTNIINSLKRGNTMNCPSNLHLFFCFSFAAALSMRQSSRCATRALSVAKHLKKDKKAREQTWTISRCYMTSFEINLRTVYKYFVTDHSCWCRLSGLELASGLAQEDLGNMQKNWNRPICFLWSGEGLLQVGPVAGGAAPPRSICSSSCRAQLLQHPGRSISFQSLVRQRSFQLFWCEKQIHPWQTCETLAEVTSPLPTLGLDPWCRWLLSSLKANFVDFRSGCTKVWVVESPMSLLLAWWHGTFYRSFRPDRLGTALLVRCKCHSSWAEMIKDLKFSTCKLMRKYLNW